MANAKTQAENYLGSIRDYVNYAGYDADRANAQEQYDIASQSLQNKYNRLVDTINTNRQQLAKDFTSGRATVANEYYANRNLKTGADLSSYLRGTGVGALNKNLNRMNLGNSLSNLANTYYSGRDDLNNELRYAGQDYDINTRTARNTLNTQIADANARQKEGENDYANKVATLAEQIQARWDNNANAKASLQAQIDAAEKSQELEFLKELDRLVDGTQEGYDRAITLYRTYKGGTDGDARKFLNQYNMYAPEIVKSNEMGAKHGIRSAVLDDNGNIMQTGESVAAMPISKAEYDKMSSIQKWWFNLWGGEVR